MSSPLSGIPVRSRRRMAATVGLFAMLFLAIGVVCAAGAAQSSTGSGAATAFAVVALVVAALLALIGYGLLRSVRAELGERELDAAIEGVVGRHGAPLPHSCGHEHDPDELHVTDACGHDGSGASCRHDCQTCVLAGLRPSPSPRVR